MAHTKHSFALHMTTSLDPTLIALGRQLMIVDDVLWHRIFNVLRLDVGEQVILFNDVCVVTINLVKIKKNTIGGVIVACAPIVVPVPHITLYQSILKREAFEDVAYYAAQMGANEFVPLITQKMHRSWGSPKDVERLNHVMIAACEQAKQYALPHINKPLELDQAIQQISRAGASSIAIYADPEGKSLLEVLNDVARSAYKNIGIFIGPEGGFAEDEVAVLAKNGVRACALTRSILRSQEAAGVLLGSLRSTA